MNRRLKKLNRSRERFHRLYEAEESKDDGGGGASTSEQDKHLEHAFKDLYRLARPTFKPCKDKCRDGNDEPCDKDTICNILSGRCIEKTNRKFRLSENYWKQFKDPKTPFSNLPNEVIRFILNEYADREDVNLVSKEFDTRNSTIIDIRKIPEDKIKNFKALLKKSQKTLENLTIVGLSMENVDIKSLVISEIAGLENLASLDISGNEIGPDGAEVIATLTKLTSLDIALNDLRPDGAEVIAEAIKKGGLPKLTSLDISGNEIGPDGARAIALAIAGLKNLASLNIRDNEIGPRGAEAIAKLTNLTSLDIGRNIIGFDGAKEIAEVIKKGGLPNLTSLNISGNGIGTDGATEIATLTKLTSLDISWNFIGDDGATEIAKLTNLASLNISGNDIVDSGIVAIVNAIKLGKLPNLEFLDISWNDNIGPSAARAIVGLENFANLSIVSNWYDDY